LWARLGATFRLGPSKGELSALLSNIGLKWLTFISLGLNDADTLKFRAVLTYYYTEQHVHTQMDGLMPE